ncbi:sodium:proton antiporter, partial [Vibrio cyclitrophicus]
MLGIQLSAVLSLFFFSTVAAASTSQLGESLSLTNSFAGYLSLTIFVVA